MMSARFQIIEKLTILAASLCGNLCVGWFSGKMLRPLTTQQQGSIPLRYLCK